MKLKNILACGLVSTALVSGAAFGMGVITVVNKTDSPIKVLVNGIETPSFDIPQGKKNDGGGAIQTLKTLAHNCGGMNHMKECKIKYTLNGQTLLTATIQSLGSASLSYNATPDTQACLTNDTNPSSSVCSSNLPSTFNLLENNNVLFHSVK